MARDYRDRIERAVNKSDLLINNLMIDLKECKLNKIEKEDKIIDLHKQIYEIKKHFFNSDYEPFYKP